MARKRGSRTTVSRKRDIIHHITSPIPRLLPRPIVIRDPSPLFSMQDFRISDPLPKDFRPQRMIDASPAYVKTVFTQSRPWHMPRIERQLHMGAIVCVRRKQRREIIFAVGAGGKRGKRGNYQRNSNSEFICRRK